MPSLHKGIDRREASRRSAGSVRGHDATLRFRGPVLPDGEARDLYVVDGRVTLEPVAGAETAAEGWIVPGLVDAHCHIGLDAHGAVDEATTEQQALDDRDAGALLLRDCGSPADTRWVQERDDLPRLIRCGRHIARTRRYIRNFAHEIEPEDLASYVAQEAQAGDGWVKLVGDWISREDGRPHAVVPGRGVRRRDRHRPRARRAGHRPLLRRDRAAVAGRGGHRLHRARHRPHRRPGRDDGREGHGAGADGRSSSTTSRCTPSQAGEKFPAYADHMLDLHARRRETIMAAYDAGVPIFAGTDAGGVLPHGGIADEVAELAAYGMPAEYALGAASWRAREWLGWNATLEEGAPADFVVYPRDPRADLTVLREPAAVVLRGQVV